MTNQDKQKHKLIVYIPYLTLLQLTHSIRPHIAKMFSSVRANTPTKNLPVSKMTYAFDYRIIVFALFNNIRFDDHPLVKALFKKRSIFISEHPPESEPTCEYSTLHYHGIIEIPKDTRFDNDRIINDIKKHCAFFKNQAAVTPVNFLAYMQIPPRQIIFKNSLLNSVLDYLLSEVTSQLIQSIKEKRESKFIHKSSINDDISEIMKWIKKNAFAK